MIPRVNSNSQPATSQVNHADTPASNTPVTSASATSQPSAPASSAGQVAPESSASNQQKY